MADVLQLFIDRTATPIGELIVVADGEGRLRAIDWTDREAGMLRSLRLQYGPRGFALTPKRNPGGLTRAMSNYFKGDLDAIERLPVATNGTPFQRKVWRALRRIPTGTTLSYAELARRTGRASAVRAVGHANGANPISIVMPCHRAVGR